MGLRLLHRPGFPLFTARVAGDSMLPAYAAGDWVVVARLWRPRPGQVVALADPRDGRLLVKRLAGPHDDGWWVLGDNPERSTDSRTFGSVADDGLLGRVLFRYGRSGA